MKAPKPPVSPSLVFAALLGLANVGPSCADGTRETASPVGCADGTREGFVSTASFPGLAACAGIWTGDVATAGGLCAPGWHVCRGAEAVWKGVAYTDALAFEGCYALDAAQDNFACHAGCSAAVASGIDSPGNVDMGGVGNGCQWKFPAMRGCIADGRIDASENSGTGCGYHAGLTGVVCCAD